MSFLNIFLTVGTPLHTRDEHEESCSHNYIAPIINQVRDQGEDHGTGGPGDPSDNVRYVPQVGRGKLHRPHVDP